MYCTALPCAVIYFTALHCTVLCCNVLYCTVIHCTVIYCTVLYCTALHCTVLCCTALCCNVRVRSLGLLLQSSSCRIPHTYAQTRHRPSYCTHYIPTFLLFVTPPSPLTLLSPITLHSLLHPPPIALPSPYSQVSRGLRISKARTDERTYTHTLRSTKWRTRNSGYRIPGWYLRDYGLYPKQ